MMTREMIYLAGLVHDLGKFWQRGDIDSPQASTVLSPVIKALEDTIEPSQRQMAYRLWTLQFLQNHQQFYGHLLGAEGYQEVYDVIAQSYQKEANPNALLMRRAIELASANAPSSGATPLLQPVLANLLRTDKRGDYAFPIGKLSVDQPFFPKTIDQISSTLEKYQTLWNEFDLAIKELHQRRFSSITEYTENLLFVLLRYTVSITCGYDQLEDVSLYDHLKSCGAYTSCLFTYLGINNQKADELQVDTDAFLLVGGDLSGIQNYIYDIVSANAAKNLKGRSFYLQMLSDNVVQYILKELELPSACVIYTSGGSFYLFAPNTVQVKDKLDILGRSVSTYLYEVHRTQLYLSVSYTSIRLRDLYQNQIDQVWRRLSEALNQGKRQKFSHILSSYYHDFFEPIEVGGQQPRDVITNEEFSVEEWNARKTSQLPLQIDGDPEKPIKEQTYLQIELGKRLKQAVCWVQTEQPLLAYGNIRGFSVRGLGIHNYLLSVEDLKAFNGQISGQELTVLVLSDDSGDQELIEKTFKNCHLILGFTFYGGNRFPAKEDGSPLEFDDLASSLPGADKLGVLRMDVDGLGAIFAQGLGTAKRTFSRYSAVSRNLDFFFKGYLNKIWERDLFSKTSYILYSGGDDLFILGNWHAVTEMALQIRKDFAAWTCGNPHLTLSGGLAIVPGKFPIAKAALLAEDAEKQAKKYNWENNTQTFKLHKNALCLFDVPLNGDHELEIVLQLHSQLLGFVESKKLPRGILQKLINYKIKAEDQAARNKNPSWRWFMAYDFGRAAEQDGKKAPEVKPFYKELQLAAITDKWNNEYIRGKHTFLELAAVAARWVELQTK